MALKWLREKMKYLTWVLWIVIAAFIVLVFFEWGGVNQMGSQTNAVVATVGKERITLDEFQRYYRNIESYYRNIFQDNFNNDLLEQLNLPRQALTQLVDNKIKLIEARRLGLEATDEEVRQAILEQPVFQNESGRFVGEEEYERILRSYLRQRPEQFERTIREDVLRQKLDTMLADTVYISEDEVERAYREQAERAKIRFLQAPSTRYRGQVEVTQAELEALYETKRADYQLPEQRVVDYVLIDKIQLRQEVEIPDEEIQAFYDSHIEDYTRPEEVTARHILLRDSATRSDEEAEAKLEELKGRIDGGEDFATLASAHSEDTSSATNGGSLGSFARGAWGEDFEAIVFDSTPGTLVGPVKTQYGHHLIEVQALDAGGPRPLEAVQAQVRSRMINDRVEELAAERAQSVAQRITDDGIASAEALQTLAEAEGLGFQQTKPFGNGDIVPGVGRVQAFGDATFGMEVGGISEPVQIPRGWAVLRLAEVKEPRVPELSEVEAQVRTEVEREKLMDAAFAELEEARTALGGGKTLDELATDLGLEIKESEEFGRDGTIAGVGRNLEVIEAALALDEGGVGGPFRDNQGALLFEVAERKGFDATAFEAEKEQTRATLESERVSQVLASLVEVRRRDLAPKILDPALAEELGLAVDFGQSS